RNVEGGEGIQVPAAFDDDRPRRDLDLHAHAALLPVGEQVGVVGLPALARRVGDGDIARCHEGARGSPRNVNNDKDKDLEPLSISPDSPSRAGRAAGLTPPGMVLEWSLIWPSHAPERLPLPLCSTSLLGWLS